MTCARVLRLGGALAALLIMSSSGAASADALDPRTEGCEGKSAGDNCKQFSGGDGACVQSTCSKLDYSHGSPPTGSISYACLMCLPPPDAGHATATSSAKDPPAAGSSHGCRSDVGGPMLEPLTALGGGLVVVSIGALAWLGRRRAGRARRRGR
jgi:hypothetical protein